MVASRDLVEARVEQFLDLDTSLRELGYPLTARALPPVPPISDPVRQGQALAEMLRERTGIGDEDLPPELEGLSRWLERNWGVDVCLEPLDGGVDGLALRDGGLRLALISSTITVTRQRFVLAHVLCHLAIGDQRMTVDEDVSVGSSPEEVRANAFAAAFLMPSAAIRAAAGGKRIDEGLVAELLGRFRVSVDVLAFRLYAVGVVNAHGRDLIRAMSSAQITLRPGRVEDLQVRDERRAPGCLLARAMAAFTAGVLDVDPVAALLETDPDRLRIELGPPPFPASGSGGSLVL